MKAIQFVLIFLFSLGLMAQENKVSVSVAPAPNAAAIGESGDIPVGEFSGTANVSVPIHTVASRAGTVPISLGYHTNGIRVAEEAGPVGLGWSLNAGGMITRAIRGYDDFGTESLSISCGASPNNYTNFYRLLKDNLIPDGPPIGAATGAGTVFEQGYLHAGSPTGGDLAFDGVSINSEVFCQNGYDTRDYQSDLYSFNFMGYNGKFVLVRANDGTVTAKTLTASRLKFDLDVNSSNEASWIITTPDGTKCYFGQTNASRQKTYQISRTKYFKENIPQQDPCDNLEVPIRHDEYFSAWYLDKIESPIGGETVIEEVLFEYERITTGEGNPYVYPLPSFTTKLMTVGDYVDYVRVGDCSISGPKDREYKTVTLVAYDNTVLKRITAPSIQEEVEFVYSGDRSDLLNGLKLDEVLVTRGGDPFKSIQLSYDYFNANYTPFTNKWTYDAWPLVQAENDNDPEIFWAIVETVFRPRTITSNFDDLRLKLTNVQHQSIDGQGALEYSFEYNQDLPAKTSYGTDFWGFYNGGNDNDGPFSSYEDVAYWKNDDCTLTPVEINHPGYDRDVSPEHCKQGLLRRIYYPTGGFTDFEYEPNDFMDLEYEVTGLEAASIGLNQSIICTPSALPQDVGPFLVGENSPISGQEGNVQLSWSLYNVCSGDDFGIKFILEKVNQDGTSEEVKYWTTSDLEDNELLTDCEITPVTSVCSANVVVWLENNTEYILRMIPEDENETQFSDNVRNADMTITWEEHESTTSYNIGGGNRIASVTSYTGEGEKAFKKSYSYEGADGTLTSGISVNPATPNYTFRHVNNFASNEGGGICSIEQITIYSVRSSVSAFPLANALVGNMVSYGRVEVEHEGKGSEVKTFFEPAMNDLPFYFRIFDAPTFVSARIGQPLSVITKNSSDQEVRSVDYQYANDYTAADGSTSPDDPLDLNWNIQTVLSASVEFTGNGWSPFENCIFDVRPTLFVYADVPQWHRLTSIVTEDKGADGNTSTSTQSFTYDSEYFTKRSETIQGPGGTKTTSYRYPFDLNNEYSHLMEANMFGIPVETTSPNGSTYITEYDEDLLVPAKLTERYENGDEIILSEVTNPYFGIKFTDDAYPHFIQQHGFDVPERYFWSNGLLTGKKFRKHRQTFKYYPSRQLEYQIDIDGQRIDYRYDGLQRLEQMSARDEKITTVYEYQIGNGGNSISATTNIVDGGEGEVQTAISTFDGLGRPLTTSENGIVKTALVYDRFGRVAEQLYMPGYGMTVLGYDDSPLNRITRETYPDDSSIGLRYLVDNYGFQQVERTDEKGNLTFTSIDVFGRTARQISKLSSPSGASQDVITTYEYTSWDAPSKITPPLGPVYSYAYDERRRLTGKTIPDGGTTEYIYDDNNRLKGTNLPNGSYIGVRYDSYGRELETALLDVPAADDDQPFTFFSSNNKLTRTLYGNDYNELIKMGKVIESHTRILLPDGNLGNWASTGYEYDNLGRVENTIDAVALPDAFFNVSNSLTLDGRDLATNTTTNVSFVLGQRNELSQSNTLDIFGRPRNSNSVLTVEPGGILPGVVQSGAMNVLFAYNDADQLTKRQLLPASTGGYYEEVMGYTARGWLSNINNPVGRSFDAGICEVPNGDVYSQCEDGVATIEELFELLYTGDNVQLPEIDVCEDEPELCFLNVADFTTSIDFTGSLPGMASEMDRNCGGMADPPFAGPPGSGSFHLDFRVISDVITIQLEAIAGSPTFGDPPVLVPLNYPYDFSTGMDNDPEVERFRTDLGNWLTDNGHVYNAINVFVPEAFNYDWLEDVRNCGTSGYRCQYLGRESIQVEVLGSSFYFLGIETNYAEEVHHSCDKDGRINVVTRLQQEGYVLFDESNRTVVLCPETDDEVLVIDHEDGFNNGDLDQCSVWDCPLPTAAGCDENTQQSQQDVVTALYANFLGEGGPPDGNEILPTLGTMAFPATLHAVQLCDGSVVYLFDFQISALPEPYALLGEMEITGADMSVATVTQTEGPNQLFALKMEYEDNGNIETATWKTTYHVPKRYEYTYDDLNRIKSATYSAVTTDPAQAAAAENMFSVQDISYDKLGNIRSLTRYGTLECSGDGTPGVAPIDILNYNYTYGQEGTSYPQDDPGIGDEPESVPTTANHFSRLMNVIDNAPDDGFWQQGFDPNDYYGNTNEDQEVYQYDAAGRLIADPYKGITIQYNHLDLPRIITTPEGSIEITYDASGRKWMQLTGETKRLYAGGMEFKKVDSEFIIEAANTGDGRLVVDVDNGESTQVGDGTPPASSDIQIYAEYHHKDHLGNVRVAFNDRDGDGLVTLVGESVGIEVTQELDYYPFGLQQRNTGVFYAAEEASNRYQYNGKEWITEVGLNDYGARWYDPAIGRWNATDPLAEVIPAYSPYAYTFNNPITYHDPTGMMGESAFDSPKHVASTIVNGNGVIIDHKDDGDPFVYYSHDGSTDKSTLTKIGLERPGGRYLVGSRLTSDFGAYFPIEPIYPLGMNMASGGLSQTFIIEETLSSIPKAAVKGIIFIFSKGGLKTLFKNLFKRSGRKKAAKSSVKAAAQSVTDEALNEVIDGNTAKALNVLLKANLPDELREIALVNSSRLSRVEKLRRNHQINFEEYNIEVNKITVAIIYIANQLK